MDSQKLENLLNLSLDSTMEEREKSRVLNVGYNPEERTWELIVKYHGNIDRLNDELVRVEKLPSGYAIIQLPQSLVPVLAEMEEIEFVEMPKRLYFSVNVGKEASCIPQVTLREPYLTGKGVLVAVIDSGIDYRHVDFRNADGSTRILSLWDQTVAPDPARGFAPPTGFSTGTEFSREQIDAALKQATQAAGDFLVPSRDISGHGTAVAGIAAGNGNESGGLYAGVAPESELLIVKLGNPAPDSFPRTTELMRALAYVIGKAQLLQQPMAINLSFGNTYGAHRGTALLERYVNNISEIWKNVICVGAGNEGSAAGHAAGILNGGPRSVELSVGAYERTVSVQLWKNYVDTFRITLRSPGGEEQLVRTDRRGRSSIRMEGTEVLIYVGEPSPYAVYQEIFFDFIPINTYITSGVWTFVLEPVAITDGSYSLYLPSEAARNADTSFFAPTQQITLTIPSTAARAITVGAYNTSFDAYADFSGRGYTDIFAVKPDLAAPGVGITTARAGGGYAPFTGTSFATPFVTGSAALLMEWGILRGNDPYLYGEKVKAYLRRGAQPIRGLDTYPNPMVGYGALCVARSLETDL